METLSARRVPQHERKWAAVLCHPGGGRDLCPPWAPAFAGVTERAGRGVRVDFHWRSNDDAPSDRYARRVVGRAQGTSGERKGAHPAARPIERGAARAALGQDRKAL